MSLADIRTKVRRLTRSPAEAQLTTAQLDDYINTFILYDFPEHLRLQTLKQPVISTVQPYLEDVAISQNIISVHLPVYIAGQEIYLSQDPAEFYRLYPKILSKVQIATGDGATVNFTGNLQTTPVLRDEVYITSIAANNDGIIVNDDGAGAFEGNIGAGVNTIDYITGAYDVTFSNAPGDGEPIYSQTYPYVAGKPQMALYYNNELVFRPVPDQPYPLEYQAYVQPTQLLDAADNPDLNQWWQYIAYGAAKKILEDRLDMETVALILPEFNQQERLVLRKTIDIMSKERSATIYVGTSSWNNFSNFNGY